MSASPLLAPAPPSGRRSPARIKSIVAIAGGIALLVGGGGTYALWSTQQALEADVQTGDLDLTLGTATWTIDGLLTPSAPVADATAVRIVPGDVLTLTQPLTVTLVGDTIEADLSIVDAGVIPPAYADYVTVVFAAAGLGAETAPGTYRVTPATDGVIQTTVTITFASGTPDRIAANQTFDLSGIVFALEQAAS